MNATQVLNALDRASITHAAADGRRVLGQEANNLRAHIQRAERAAKLRNSLAQIKGSSNQAEAQRADIHQQLRAIGAVDVAAAVAEAQRTLALWS